MLKMERWINEHRNDPQRSRLKRLVPQLGNFFTSLRLVDAFQVHGCMCMSACVHVYVCACMRVRVCAYARVCVCARVSVCVRVLCVGVDAWVRE